MQGLLPAATLVNTQFFKDSSSSGQLNGELSDEVQS